MDSKYWKSSPFGENSLFSPKLEKSLLRIEFIKCKCAENQILIYFNVIGGLLKTSKAYISIVISNTPDVRGAIITQEISIESSASQIICVKIDSFNHTRLITDTATIYKAMLVCGNEIAYSEDFKIANNNISYDTKSSINNACLCDRSITEKEFKEIILGLRGDKTKQNLILFGDSDSPIPNEDKSFKKILDQLNSTMFKYGITKCIHKIHFIAQVFHETNGFRTMVEYNGINKKYAPYYGRGVMQLTNETNYKLYTEYYNNDSGLAYIDFVSTPDVLATSLYHAFNSGGWFWRYGKILTRNYWNPQNSNLNSLKPYNIVFPTRIIKYYHKNGTDTDYNVLDLNVIAESDITDAVSYLVNGGSNGLEERRKYVVQLKEIMNYEKCISRDY